MGGKALSDREQEGVIASIGKPLRGLSRRGVRKMDSGLYSFHVRALTGKTNTEHVERTGMTLMDASAALDLHRNVIARFFTLPEPDALAYVESYVGRQRRYIIKSTVLIGWIARGTLCKRGFLYGEGWTPSGVWGARVQDAQAAWLREYIDSAALKRLWCLAKLHEDMGLPAPAVTASGQHTRNWWRRADIVAWLATHPHYQTAAAKKEFAL